MYNEFYGLNDKPFQLTPDPRFYFESATHRKAMAYLGYGLAQGEGFIVITGEIGAGKTTLVAHLMDTVDPARVHAINVASTQIEGDDLLRLIATGLGIETAGADKALLLSKIDMTLQEKAKAGQRTLLIVDEAQGLPTSALEELRMLTNFQSGASAMVQVLLLGQPEFRDRLNTADDLEQLRQRVIATHHLTAMDGDEIGPYLAHRLKLVGWNGRPQFTEDAIEALREHSGGLPRKLNTLANRVLLLGSVEQVSVIDSAIVEAVVADLARDTGGDVEGELLLQPQEQALPESEMEPTSVSFGDFASLASASAVPALAPEPELAAVVEAVAEEEAVEAPVAGYASLAPVAMPMAEHAPAFASPVAIDEHTLDLKARVAMLEAQVEEQDVALRRVLGLLVEWVEADGGHAPAMSAHRSPATYNPAA